MGLFNKKYKKNFVFMNLKNINYKFFIFKKSSLFVNPFFIGKKLTIYNGIEKKILLIRENMVGFRLGEFILTRKAFKFPKKKKKINGSYIKSNI